MTEPHTLRSLAGITVATPALSDSALVMVDCQNTYTRGIMRLVDVDSALDEVQHLLDRARRAGATIIHIAHDSGPDSPFDYGAEIGQIVPAVAPRGDEPTIVKAYPNAFVETDLDARLQAAGRKAVVLAGFMTHMCISSTARGAFNLGYACTVVGKATATRPLPGIDGAVIDAASLQRASLAAIADLFAQVVPDNAALAD